MRRKVKSKTKDKSMFRRTAQSTKAINLANKAFRGGIRL